MSLVLLAAELNKTLDSDIFLKWFACRTVMLGNGLSFERPIKSSGLLSYFMAFMSTFPHWTVASEGRLLIEKYLCFFPYISSYMLFYE